MSPQPSRRVRTLSAIAVLAVSCWCAGCDGELGQSFREATRDEFETAANALLDGVVQGVFEVYDPDEDAPSE